MLRSFISSPSTSPSSSSAFSYSTSGHNTCHNSSPSHTHMHIGKEYRIKPSTNYVVKYINSCITQTHMLRYTSMFIKHTSVLHDCENKGVEGAIGCVLGSAVDVELLSTTQYRAGHLLSSPSFPCVRQLLSSPGKS